MQSCCTKNCVMEKIKSQDEPNANRKIDDTQTLQITAKNRIQIHHKPLHKQGRKVVNDWRSSSNSIDHLDWNRIIDSSKSICGVWELFLRILCECWTVELKLERCFCNINIQHSRPPFTTADIIEVFELNAEHTSKKIWKKQSDKKKRTTQTWVDYFHV